MTYRILNGVRFFLIREDMLRAFDKEFEIIIEVLAHNEANSYGNPWLQTTVEVSVMDLNTMQEASVYQTGVTCTDAFDWLYTESVLTLVDKARKQLEFLS